MRYIFYSQLDAAGRAALTRRPASREQEHVARQVAAVEQQLLQSGDAALQQLGQRFDGVYLEPQQFAIAPNFWSEAWQGLDDQLLAALQTALDNIAKFHRHELPRRAEARVETTKGVHCWREFRALDSVGLYIPGGSAPLFSTMLMLGIPAIIAGCRRIIFCSPPVNLSVNPRNKFSGNAPFAPEAGVYAAAPMLACMELLRQFSKKLAAAAGREAISTPELQYFQIGGAQAIFALSYGAQAACSLPAVAKIFGPGNSYVTEAKLRVARRVAIDMPAGPSEVLIIADGDGHPATIAADLLAQAEHGSSSQVLLAAPSGHLLRRVAAEVARQATTLPRRVEIQGTLNNSYLIETKNLAEALEFSNAYAPEHLILAMTDYISLLPKISNAGSVFCGPYASESFGDYASGPNHTLPTAGFARSYSGVNTQSFGRWLTFQSVTKEGLRRLGPSVELLAEQEQLQAHKKAVTVRLQQLNLPHKKV